MNCATAQFILRFRCAGSKGNRKKHDKNERLIWRAYHESRITNHQSLITAFRKLLGLYVVFFFLTAQAISWLAFKQIPSLAVLVGGLFIVTGGIIIATAST